MFLNFILVLPNTIASIVYTYMHVHIYIYIWSFSKHTQQYFFAASFIQLSTFHFHLYLFVHSSLYCKVGQNLAPTMQVYPVVAGSAPGICQKRENIQQYKRNR